MFPYGVVVRAAGAGSRLLQAQAQAAEPTAARLAVLQQGYRQAGRRVVSLGTSQGVRPIMSCRSCSALPTCFLPNGCAACDVGHHIGVGADSVGACAATYSSAGTPCHQSMPCGSAYCAQPLSDSRSPVTLIAAHAVVPSSSK